MEASKPSLLSPDSIIRRVFSVKVKLSPESILTTEKPIEIFRDLTALFSDLFGTIDGYDSTIGDKLLAKHPLAHKFLEVLP
jgi:hypothetical protein